MTDSLIESGAGEIDASRPLATRIPATTLPELTGPTGVTWRATRDDDVESIATLLSAMAERDHPDWSETADEIAETFGHSYVDVARDSVVAEYADGRMIAHGMAMRAPEPVDYARVWLSGGVHPEHRGRGLGWQLLAWQTARAEQLLAELDLTIPGWVLSYAADRSPEHGRLLERAGYSPSRYFTTLHAELAGAALEPRDLPDGMRLEPWSPRFSEGARAAKNAAFADHWGSQPATREGWESWQGLPTFRPELSRVALAGDEVVGFITTDVNEEDWARMGRSSGYIGLVGTVREWRGKGLASALLVDVMRAYRAQGLELAVLDVDTANPTGALGVYERLGFAAVARDVAYRRLY